MRCFLFLPVFIVLLQFLACRKDKFSNDPAANLNFSQDSLLFDTVFTKIGSTTKYFRVINNNNQKIKISSIKLARGDASFYRLNVDGQPGKSFSDIEITAGDSIYVFAEVTVDPNNLTNPFVYKDSILFETNGNIQDVDLICFARNAYYHFPTTIIKFKSGGSLSYSLSSILQKDTTWATDKPHLVYGYLTIDSAFSLTIPAGAHVHFHKWSGIWVYKYGTLKVPGTASQPVIFEHDRLEPDYKDIPGQWGLIWVQEGSNQNLINHAIIRNAQVGIYAAYSPFDFNLPADPNAPKKLRIMNTRIENCSAIGVYGKYFTIEMGNSVISNCGRQLLAAQFGGSYSFRHCTFANYWKNTVRNDASIYLNNYAEDESHTIYPFKTDSAWFDNCIIDGLNKEEVKIDTTTAVSNIFKNVRFNYCMLKTELPTSSIPYFFQQVLQNTSAKFKNPDAFDFRLNSNSAAIDYGIQLQGYTSDIIANPRDTKPDLGAYEFK